MYCRHSVEVETRIARLLALEIPAGASRIKNASILDELIPVGALSDAFARPECGGQVVFAGRVRNNTKGRAVEWLEYEAQQTLAEDTMRQVLAEAIKEFNLYDAFCVHRVGRLFPGQCAVLVITATPHRTAAYNGNRYIIDEVKKRAAIWKKEYFADGVQSWQ
jgi:molybdopterin synthase catalytic subunit